MAKLNGNTFKWRPVSLLLLCCATATLAKTGSSTSASFSPASVSASFSSSFAATDARIFITYFHAHGVRSITLIVCPEDIATLTQQQYVRALLHQFHLNGFYVRIFHGDDYANAADAESDAGNRTAAVWVPSTFRSDNATRRPLRLQLHPLATKSGVLVLQFSTACALNVLRWSAAVEHNYFITSRFWLLLTNAHEHITLLNDAEIFLPPDSEVRVMVQQQQSQQLRPLQVTPFALIDVYKVAAENPLRQRQVGTDAVLQDAASMLRALQQFGSAITYRQNLEGITFKTGLVIAFPDVFTDIEDLSRRQVDTISKVNNHLTLELANKLNMRFNTHQTDNYGWHQPNGSFDGLMGRFQRSELDFAQQAIFMRLDRIALVDFVAETYRVRAGLMFRQPPLSAVANIFAMPFSTAVWISILLFMFFVVGVLAVELVYSPHTHHMDVLDCALFVWGAMCQQGFYVNLMNRSARIIIFTTFVATLFLYTSFSANIVALLQSPSEAIHTLSDLAQSPLEIGVQDTVYNKIYFNESTNPVTSHLYHKKIAPKGDNILMRPSVGMNKVRTGMFAYQVELQAGYQIISDTFSEPEKCGLKELEPFQLPMIAVPTRKNFPYKELFRRQLRWQREVGLVNREGRKWFPQKPKCEGGVSGFVSIGITECRYALGMFGFGLLLGAICFVMELAVNYLVEQVEATKGTTDALCAGKEAAK